MYKKILAALNEHLNSEAAARYALNLARTVNAKLYLVFVAEEKQSAEDISRAGEAVKRLFIEAKEAGLDAEAITETGEPVKRICEFVKTEGIDLVFASTRREDVKRRFYAGTVARRLSLSLPCSVALVRVVHMGRIKPRGILVPLKAKIDRIDERAYFTGKLAQAFGSTVYLLHAPRNISRFFHGEVHLTPLQWEKRLPADISGFMERMKKYKVVHGGRQTPGKAAKAIAIEALSKRHDLIIMGASERSLINSFLKGNPVEEVLREAPSDIIVLRPRKSENT